VSKNGNRKIQNAPYIETGPKEDKEKRTLHSVKKKGILIATKKKRENPERGGREPEEGISESNLFGDLDSERYD